MVARLKKPCHGVGDVPDQAEPGGTWLSADPMGPGVRRPFANGVFCFGSRLS